MQSVTIKTSLYLVFSLVNGKMHGQLKATFQNNYNRINTNEKDKSTQTPPTKQTVTLMGKVLLKVGIATI